MTIGRIPSVEGGIQPTIVDAKGDLIAAVAADSVNRLAVGSNDQVLVADSSASTGLAWKSYGSQLSSSNPVLNGAFDIWQRGTSAATASGSTTGFAADRWQMYRGGFASGGTVSRQAASLTGFEYSVRVQRDSGNTSTAGLFLAQSFESVNSIPYAGKTVTLSFYAKAGANFSAGSSIVEATLATGTGTNQNITGGFTGQVNAIQQNTILTTSWQRFSVTGTIASDKTQLAIYFLYNPTGTAGANDWMEITGVQLDVGSVAQPFRRAMNTIQGELAACQRYFQRYGRDTTQRAFINATWYNTTDCHGTLHFPTEMRTYPTVTVSAGTILRIYYNGTFKDTTAIALDLANTKQILLKLTSSGGTGGDGCFTGFTTNDSYVDVSAEL